MKCTSSRAKIVTDGDELKDISSVSVRVADRWMTAGQEVSL